MIYTTVTKAQQSPLNMTFESNMRQLSQTNRERQAVNGTAANTTMIQMIAKLSMTNYSALHKSWY